MDVTIIIIMDILILSFTQIGRIIAQEEVIYSTSWDSVSDFAKWGTWCYGDGNQPCYGGEIRLASGSECLSKFDDSNCLAMTQWVNMYRTFDFTGYENISIEYELYSVGLAQSGDNCWVGYTLAPHDYYAGTYYTIDDEYTTGTTHYKSFDLPRSLDSRSVFTLYLEVFLNAQSPMNTDQCWFDNLALYGTPIATDSPTSSTSNPTHFPTENPAIPTIQTEATIYFSNFESISSWDTWSCGNGDCSVRPRSECPDVFGNTSGSCVQMLAESSLYRVVDTTGYKDIRIEVQLFAVDLESSDFCSVWWRPTLGNDDLGWAGRNGYSSNGYTFVSIGPLSSAYDDNPNFQIAIDGESMNDSQGDECWYDNLSVYGTQYIVYCSQAENCQCPPGEECIFNCEGTAQCAGIELATLYNGQTITINCIGTSACFGVTGDLSSAASVTWNCKGSNACKDAHLTSCGPDCQLFCLCDEDCITERSCGDDYRRLIGDDSFECIGIFCNIYGTRTPTAITYPPTPAPSVATPAPTTGNQIFIDKYGSDSNGCCDNETLPCSTIMYGHESFLGGNDCDLEGYDGTGTINLGDGDWYWPYDLMYDNQQVIINGNGINATFLYYNKSSGIGCESEECWLELNDLTVITSEILIRISQGTLIFNNVFFDGNASIWLIRGTVSVVMNSCVFSNHYGYYSMADGANVRLVDCEFEYQSAYLQSQISLFRIRDSTISMISSLFHHNKIPILINAQNSFIRISTSYFAYNQVNGSLFYLAQSSPSNQTECPYASGSMSMDSNWIIHNNATSLVTTQNSSLYMLTNTIVNNHCMDFCFDAIASSLTIGLPSNMLSTNQYESKLLRFYGASSFQSQLCINASGDTRDTTDSIMFSNDTNINNTRILFEDCLEPFSVSLPNISTSNLSMSDQHNVYPFYDGARVFECDANSLQCALVCNNSISCFGSTFTIKAPESTIHCGSLYACAYSTINATVFSTQSLHIICDGASSCVEIEITVKYSQAFKLDCYGAEACTRVIVEISSSPNSAISCYQLRIRRRIRAVFIKKAHFKQIQLQ